MVSVECRAMMRGGMFSCCVVYLISASSSLLLFHLHFLLNYLPRSNEYDNAKKSCGYTNAHIQYSATSFLYHF
jgi:hypothetical protein